MSEPNTKIKDLVLEEAKKGNITVFTHEGLMMAPLKEVIKQPVDGLLYDLNRNEVVILTFIEDPKWINDYASTQVIRELKSQLGESRTRVLQILKDNGYEDDAIYQLLEEKL